MLVVSQYGSVAVGGAERYISEVTQRLSLQGFELSFLASDSMTEQSNLSRPWKCMSAGAHFSWFGQVERVLDIESPDVLYAHLTVPFLSEMVITSAAKRGISVCAMYHGDVTGPGLLRKVLGEAYRRCVASKVLDKISMLCVTSEAYFNASPVLRGYKGAWRVASPGVSPVFATATRREGKPYILFVGKASVASKGFGVLYHAWKALSERWRHVDLVVAGSVPSNDYPGVRFLGHVGDERVLADLYASAEVTVLPSVSTAESFGMVLAEALISGCPVIGSQVGGIPALIQDGVDGYTVPPESEDALTSAMELMLEGSSSFRQRIADAKGQYVERFSWELTASTTGDALRDVLECDGSVKRVC